MAGTPNHMHVMLPDQGTSMVDSVQDLAGHRQVSMPSSH
jgi:hypothetical protein